MIESALTVLLYAVVCLHHHLRDHDREVAFTPTAYCRAASARMISRMFCDAVD